MDYTRVVLLPLRGQDEPGNDEGEADTHVHQGVHRAADGVHDRNLVAGDVEDHDVGQADDEAGDHHRGQPRGGADLGHLALALGLLGRVAGVLLTSFGLGHRSSFFVGASEYRGRRMSGRPWAAE